MSDHSDKLINNLEYMTDEFKEVSGGLGQLIRWTKEPRNAKDAENSIFVGVKIQGVYDKRTDNVGVNNASIYGIKTAEHGDLGVWDTTVLKAKMAQIEVGVEVVIECLGEVDAKKGGKSYIDFKVMSRKAPMSEVKAEGDAPIEAEDVKAEDIPM